MRIGQTEITVSRMDQDRHERAAYVVDSSMPGKKSARAGIITVDAAHADGSVDERSVRDAAHNALRQAQKNGIRSLGIPLLGAGRGSMTPRASAKIIAQEVFRLLHEDKAVLEEIILCADTEEAHETLEKDALGYLDYIENRLKSPFLTVDAIIEVPGGIVIIQRSNPPFGWALPGGFVDYGESLEEAVVREAKEETALDLTGIRQFHTYSDPGRDPRFHTVGTVFIATAQGAPRAGDDAAALKVVSLAEAAQLDYAFDHKQIIEDYIKSLKASGDSVKVDKR